MRRSLPLIAAVVVAVGIALHAQRTVKPVLHGRHWVAITGKPLGATAGAHDLQQGRQRRRRHLRHARRRRHHVGHARLGRRNPGAHLQPEDEEGHRHQRARRRADRRDAGVSTRAKGMDYPPEYGPLAAVTPGTPGGLMVMLAEYGTMSLKDVLAPAIQMADGYPIEALGRQRDRTHESRNEEVAVVGEGVPHASRASAHEAPEARRDLPAGRPRRHAPQTRRHRTAGARRPARPARTRSTPRTTASTRATSPGSSRAARRTSAASTPTKTSPRGR